MSLDSRKHRRHATRLIPDRAAFQRHSIYEIFGELDGVFAISGFDNFAENIITMTAVDYLVVPNHRSQRPRRLHRSKLV